MSKFTQGEWKVVQGAGLDELDVVSEDKKDICCLFSYSVSRWEEQKANAYLIAVAPKMYELLIFAMASLRDGDIPAQRLADKIEELLKEAEHE